ADARGHRGGLAQGAGADEGHGRQPLRQAGAAGLRPGARAPPVEPAYPQLHVGGPTPAVAAAALESGGRSARGTTGEAGMKHWVRNVAAVVAGLVVGSVVNMAIVAAGPALVPPPAGVDTATAEGLAAGIHLFQPKHFLSPFLAHALG